MITQKKTVEEYVYEYTMAVLTNSPFPDFEKFYSSNLDSATGDSTNGLKLENIPKIGRLAVKTSIRMYVSPSFPNNVVLPEQLQDYEGKTSYQCYFGIHSKEIQNQFGIIVNREILRKYIYVLPTKKQNEDPNFAQDVFDLLDYLASEGEVIQNQFGYPIAYEVVYP